MNPEKVGKFLRQLREEKDISQNALSNILHIDRTLISKWEHGRILPDQKYFEDLCKFYEIDVKELLEGERANKENEEELNNNIFRFFNFQDKKYRKARRITILSVIITFITVLAFFIYYFYQTYNTIRIYRVYGKSENYKMLQGLLVMTRDKSYFNVGEINKDYDRLSVYYLKDEIKKVIYEGEESKLVYILATTDDALDYDDFDDNKNYIYIDITNDDKVETIQLHFDNEYANKSLIFNDYEETSDDNEEYIDNNDIPKYIKDNYECLVDICLNQKNSIELTYDIHNKTINGILNKNDIFEYSLIKKKLTYTSKKYNFTVVNNVINCSKSNCDKEKEIYDEIFEKFLRPILQ